MANQNIKVTEKMMYWIVQQLESTKCWRWNYYLSISL